MNNSFCKMIWRYQVQLNTEVYLSFASIYINPDYMKHLIKRGLGSLKCCAWVALGLRLGCDWVALVFGFNLVYVCRVAKNNLWTILFVCLSHCKSTFRREKIRLNIYFDWNWLQLGEIYWISVQSYRYDF